MKAFVLVFALLFAACSKGHPTTIVNTADSKSQCLIDMYVPDLATEVSANNCSQGKVLVWGRENVLLTNPEGNFVSRTVEGLSAANAWRGTTKTPGYYTTVIDHPCTVVDSARIVGCPSLKP